MFPSALKPLNHATNRDFRVEVARNRIPDTSQVSIFGYSPATPNTTNINVWELQTLWVPLTTAQNHEVLSSSVSDTSAGTGARTIFVQGLDGDYNYLQETVTLNGITAVQLTNAFLFINTVTVLTAGSASSNVGNLTIRISGGGSAQAYVAASAGLSRMGRYSIPAGHFLLIHNFFELANKAGGIAGSSSIGFRLLLPNGVILQGLPQTVNNGTSTAITVPDGVVIGEKITAMFFIDSVSAVGHDISCGCTGIQGLL